MSNSEAITKWIEQLEAGDSVAAEQLWNRYYQQIVDLARKRLSGAKRAVADEEDVALSVLKSLCLGAQEGRFPKLTDRDSLWSLLLAITAYKSIDLIRRENRIKRGGSGTAGRSAAEVFDELPLSQIIENRGSPEWITLIGEQFELLVKKLDRADDPDLLPIAVAKMLGDSNADVARQLGCVRRTVERKVVLIRQIWEREIDQPA